ncbi:MAG: hypothetical protein J6L24_07685, partial [Oscillospiraceae bacterium]|nr:hypothetical protein [Oscillospiraceae bacterium]
MDHGKPAAGIIANILTSAFHEKGPAHNKIAHPHLDLLNTRYPRSQLGNGSLTAHAQIRLMLLGSPPD